MSTEHNRIASRPRIGGVLTRLGYVTYALFWFSCSIAAILGFLDELSSVSRAIFYSVFVALIVLLFLESVRRVLMYVVAGKSLLTLSFPLIAKVLLALTVLATLIAVPVYLFFDMPQERAERAAETAVYQQALDALPAAQAEQDQCETNARKNYESPECRREKLGYNSCMEYGSRTMCLSLWDYETACKPNRLALYAAGCYGSVSKLNDIIQEYEEKYHITH